MSNDKTFARKCFEKVFLEQKWGDSKNSGVNYKRKYSKTDKNKESKDD